MNLSTSPTYPAAYDASNQLTVAATTSSDGLASFSNYSSTEVHLGAPGVSILSTVPGNGYAYYSGTSMATPHVSGTAALVLSACSGLSTAALKQTLLSTVDVIPALTGLTITGGRLNAYKALQSCAPPPGFTPIRVNAGGRAYTDSLGQFWSADTGFSGGTVYSVTSAVAGTSDPTLYQSERYNPSGSVLYQFSVPAGSYSVKLKFAEIYYSLPGQRVFNILLNGSTVLANFDPTAAAGHPFAAVDKTFPVTSSGQITIQLLPVVDNPTVSAIEITSP